MKDDIGSEEVLYCLLSCLGESPEGTGAEADANATDLLLLKIDLEGSFGGDIRMASRIAGGGAST